MLAGKYRCARKAKLILAGPGPWTDDLQDLLDIHLRSYADPDLEANKKRKTGVGVVEAENGDLREEVHEIEVPGRRPAGESSRIISWIWRTLPAGAGVGGDNIDESESFYADLTQHN
jgi:hypothetical protein